MKDQAEGLRRLFRRSEPAVLPVLVPGGGQGALGANLASALARSGREVLVVDATPGEIATALGLRPRYELAHLLAGDKRLQDVLLHPQAGLRLMPAARALSGKADLERTLTELASKLTPSPELVIVYQQAATAVLDGDMLVAASPRRDNITRTYAELKRMKRGRGRLRLVVSQVADEQGARTLHRALDDTAQRYLGATIDWAGFVPDDAPLQRALAAARPVFDIDIAASSAKALIALGQSLDHWELPRLAVTH